MALIYLSLGSNLGNKEANLNKAIEIIKQEIGSIVIQSAFHKTEPWGYISANTFLNACIIADTTLSPADCLNHLKEAELRMGRLKNAENTYADRVIDMDILFYDALVQDESSLVLPHPLMHKRPFVLKPMLEIAPELIHPVLKKTIRELWEALNLQP